jgi:hypothetical protein
MVTCSQSLLDWQTTAYKLLSHTISTGVHSMTDFGFTAAEVANATRAWISASDADVRVTWDGSTDPSSTVGHLLVKDAAPVELFGNANIANLRLIRAAGSDALVTITLER